MPASDSRSKKKTGYDKYVQPKKLAIAIVVFMGILLVPLPDSMLDVAVEYTAGKAHVLDYFSEQLFGKSFEDCELWEAMTAQVLELNMIQGALGRKRALNRDAKWIGDAGFPNGESQVARYREKIERVPEETFLAMMKEAQDLRLNNLVYSDLSTAEKKKVDKAAGNIKIVVAMMAFVVICFLTEAIPLPGVAFCIGLILVFSGIVSRQEVASMFWDDAVWFIMGSLMFAAAFVKTGVDKRVCLFLFKFLAKPNVKVITGIMILVIAPAAAFISDHALAAMFLPIGIILYSNSLNLKVPVDTELAKMLFITIAMACNIGGFGSPSGGARNVIMMTYLEDMFGINIGYGEWMVYAFPFVIVMMVFLWAMVNWRFKPQIRDLSPALESLRKDLSQSGGWNRKQVVAIVIFLVMLLGWITEKSLMHQLTGIRLGIGVIAMAGAVAYLLSGVVNWRDYQEKVDWGVVWLYAGAIIFGKVMSESGAAYWMARSIIEAVEPLGLATGMGLISLGSIVTAGMTQLMADGPAAACVGPITLNMAAVSNLGTAVVPFMSLATACASSMAYLLVIGTPPNAIVYASGYLEMKDYFRVGIPCLLFALVLLIVLPTTYWVWIGFQGLPLPQ
jgi:sodium-dependent dicarboxylate transporter 2/3/5